MSEPSWVSAATIAGLFLGPISAVCITFWRENRREARGRRMHVMRQLLTAKAHPDDPTFSGAVNLIPVEFAKSASVLTALDKFIDAAARQAMTTEISNNLLAALMIDLGFSERAAWQTSRAPYVATGYADQKRANAEATKSLISLAASSERSSIAAAVMAEHVTGRPLPRRLESPPQPDRSAGQNGQ